MASNVLAGEYVPPPTGPYQSTVVINTKEQNSTGKHQVYKFPQAELFEPVKPDPYFSLSDPRGQGREPANAAIPSDMPFMTPPLLPQQNYNTGQNARGQWYDPTLYNNPWLRNTAPPQMPYSGEWNYPGNSYGYYQYPGMYRDQYNMLNAPYSAMPTPWAMRPFKPFTGR